MPKIDVYLRSIERFGAAGAVLTSGQSVVMRFPTGDRSATQVTPHDQLVVLVREVATPAVLDQIDKNRPAKFDYDSNGIRYSLAIAPKPGAWQVTIEPAVAAEAAAPAAATPAPARVPRTATAPTESGGDLAIERGQYADDASTPVTTSGSTLLDQLTAAARGARATDVYIATGESPAMRVGGVLQVAGDRGVLDAETIARELGIVAPPEARGAWTEHGSGTFAYNDGNGRVRATLVRDRRGPGAALRLLVAEPPPLDRLGLTGEVASWLDRRGLVLVSGASGSGKTTTMSALVAELGSRQRRVVSIEDPIEILHSHGSISQRQVGSHAPGIGAGVATAIREGADAIVIGEIRSQEAANAVVDAVAAGHLVIATISNGVSQLIGLLPPDRKDLGRALFERSLSGTITPVLMSGKRSFEVVSGSGG